MSNDIVKHQNQSLVPDAHNMRLLAEDFQKSGMFPNVKSLAGFVTVIAYGDEIGLGPVASLQSISIIQGKLALESKVYLALFIRSGGKIEILKKDKTESTVKFSKDGRKDFTETFTIKDAQALGFLTKNNWKMYPEEMCYWRCISKGIRAYDPDVAMGAYTVEEVRDFDAKQPKKLSTISPLNEGEFPDALKTKEELAQQVEVEDDFTDSDPDIPPDDFIDVEDEPEPEPEPTKSPAEMDEPPDDLFNKSTPQSTGTPDGDALKAIGKQIHKDLAVLGLEGKDKPSFMNWLFEYQEKKSKKYCGKDSKGAVHLSLGVLADLKGLHSQLPQALTAWRKEQ